MMWMGKLSAWGALAFGVLLAAVAALHLSWGLFPWVALAAALFLIAGFRTLKGMSGGLRLLAGVWGLAAGLLAQPISTASEPPNDNLYSVDLSPVLSVLMSALPWIALAGLALTVLHQEKKK